MVTAHDLSHLAEANINDIYLDYDPTIEAYDVAHGKIYRNIRRKTADITKQFIHKYGERELTGVVIDGLAGEVESTLLEIIARPHDYAAHTSNLVDAERHLANNRDEISETYKEHGGSDAASDPVLAVDVWNKVCAEEVAQYWKTKAGWLYDSLTDL